MTDQTENQAPEELETADPIGEEGRWKMDMVSSAITALMHEIPPHLALIIMRERTQWIARVLQMDGDSFGDWMRYERDLVAITCPECFSCFRFDVLLGETEGVDIPTCSSCGNTDGMDPAGHRIPEVVDLSCPAKHTHSIGTGLCVSPLLCATEGCEEYIHVPRHLCSRCVDCGGELYDLGEIIGGDFAGQDRVISLGLAHAANVEVGDEDPVDRMVDRALVRVFWRSEDGGDTTDEHIDPASWQAGAAGMMCCASGCNLDEP